MHGADSFSSEELRAGMWKAKWCETRQAGQSGPIILVKGMERAICVYVCAHIVWYICICTVKRMHVSACTYVCACICSCFSVCTCVSNVSMGMCALVCMQGSLHVPLCACV